MDAFLVRRDTTPKEKEKEEESENIQVLKKECLIDPNFICGDEESGTMVAILGGGIFSVSCPGRGIKKSPEFDLLGDEICKTRSDFKKQDLRHDVRFALRHFLVNSSSKDGQSWCFLKTHFILPVLSRLTSSRVVRQVRISKLDASNAQQIATELFAKFGLQLPDSSQNNAYKQENRERHKAYAVRGLTILLRLQALHKEKFCIGLQRIVGNVYETTWIFLEQVPSEEGTRKEYMDCGNCLARGVLGMLLESADGNNDSTTFSDKIIMEKLEQKYLSAENTSVSPPRKRAKRC